MVVVKELAAKLEIELSAKLVDAFADALGLHLDVLVLIKAFLHKAP